MSGRIVDAAVAFVTTRELVAALTASRDALYCLRAEPITPAGYADAVAEAQTDPTARFSYVKPSQDVPCWKQRIEGPEDVIRPDRSTWCEPCQQRQDLHEQVQAATRRRGAQLRALKRAVIGRPKSRALASDVRAIQQAVEAQLPEDEPDCVRPWVYETAVRVMTERATAPPFQSRVRPWLLACFGEAVAADRAERNHRFLEEALELVQALGCTRDDVAQLVNYVYGRPVGEPSQEVGGVMVTLAALCLANDLDLHAAAETELGRVWGAIEKIRAKQATKPHGSPIPLAEESSHG